MKTKELTPKQTKAITALLAAGSVAEAAKLAGVGERTMWRWLSEDSFIATLRQAEGALLDTATRRLMALQHAAIATLQHYVTDETAPDSVRLRAADTVLGYLLKFHELRNVEARLAALEEQLAGGAGAIQRVTIAYEDVP